MSEKQPEAKKRCGAQEKQDSQDLNINATLSQIKNKIIIMSGKGGGGKQASHWYRGGDGSHCNRNQHA